MRTFFTIAVFTAVLHLIPAGRMTHSQPCALQGSVVYYQNGRSLPLHNILIQVNTEPMKLIHYPDNSFYLTGIPAGKTRVSFFIHAPLAGNFIFHLPAVHTEPGSTLDLKEVIVAEKSKVRYNPILSAPPVNKTVILDGINYTPADNATSADKNNFFRSLFTKETWRDVLFNFGNKIIIEYPKPDYLRFITITGYADDAQNEDENDGLGYAAEVYRYILDNFNLNPEIFIISSGSGVRPVPGRNAKKRSAGLVEIEFYSSDFY